MSHRTGFTFVIAIAILLALAVPSQAQIYALRDANGTLVLSDRPLGPDAEKFEAPRTAPVHVTREVDTVSDSRFEDFILEHAATFDVRPSLVRAVIQVESAYNPRARSPKGAMGLMQLMPATARALGVRNPFDPNQNIRGGIEYLRQLLDRFEGNEELALAAYNAGPGAVERFGTTIPPFRETRDYVQKVKGQTVVQAARTPMLEIYKWFETVDGAEVPRYSNVKPSSGEYEVVSRQRK